MEQTQGSEMFDRNREIIIHLSKRAFSKGDYLEKVGHIKDFERSFYPSCPKQLCEQQAALFLSSPLHLSMHFSAPSTPKYYHQTFIATMTQHAKELGYKKSSVPKRSTIIFLGLGAGLQIPALLKKVRYTDVIIIENDVNSLELACNHIDIAQLQTHCRKHGGNLHILSIESYADFIDSMRSILKKHGYHLLADISLFRHYNTPLYDEIVDKFRSWRNRLASMWGFFEDELIGLSHTIQNQRHILKSAPKLASYFTIQPKVVIVGNGPSLDKEIEALAQAKDVVIVSCGTAVASLLRLGIIPDFHVEMERTADIFELKADSLSDPRLNSTILLTLNTVSPKLLALFENKLVFPKANDIGTEILRDGDHTFEPLYHCNPTVVNAALAIMLKLGFTNIALIGCDFGFRDEQQHHSQYSQYHDNQDPLFLNKMHAELSVKGNFGGVVHSTRIFNEARLSLEALIARCNHETIINASDGAYIQGTKTSTLDHFLRSPSATDIKQAVASIREGFPSYLRQHGNTKVIDNVELEVQMHLQALQKEIEGSQGAVDLLTNLNNFIYGLEQDECVARKVLLSGSFKYLSVTIASHINHIPPQQWESYISVAKAQLLHILSGYIQRLNTI
ncbi:motility associated factor glycosyltransferase family protein [Pseudoalteromonas sp. T1lg23B]|uniref:motility associated factor glycosyltransferase family protein n=1 Tax=Pseudoalteromonas sp. T1lg23B TaxID=2077097 RepID=UPI001319CFFB|nr:6-hydroxymethylpterin diphosphokinase MptE-like protein [Pseudoalteromonas sp. T1lg23B]